MRLGDTRWVRDKHDGGGHLAPVKCLEELSQEKGLEGLVVSQVSGESLERACQARVLGFMREGIQERVIVG